jgi:hypothetical protein
MRLTFASSPPKSAVVLLSLLCLTGLISAIWTLLTAWHFPNPSEKARINALKKFSASASLPPNVTAISTPSPGGPRNQNLPSTTYHIAGTHTTTPAAIMPLTPFPGYRGTETWRSTMLITGTIKCATIVIRPDGKRECWWDHIESDHEGEEWDTVSQTAMPILSSGFGRRVGENAQKDCETEAET